MLNSYKYKIGDNVLKYEDLGTKRHIQARYATRINDRYVLDNGDIVTEYDITLYSAPITRLAMENKEFKINISKIMEKFNALEKKINEKVFKPKPVESIFGSWYGMSIASLITDQMNETQEEPKIPTLEERIEQLEAKKIKKVSKKKNKKSKK